MSNAAKFTVEVHAVGSLSVVERLARSDVRHQAMQLACHTAKYAAHGAVFLRVLDGRKVVSEYTVRGGVWTRVFGTEIRGMEGSDGAACYMLAFPFVSRERAAFQAA